MTLRVSTGSLYWTMGAACAKVPAVGTRWGGWGRSKVLQEGWGGWGAQSRLGLGSRTPSQMG